ncbi:hypothetical protein FOZ63_013358 [Perkinsus olseni]|uniref:Uncharacterized protein n=1 Tax=Perkinsus olseni TaxID=32597 RepID=A0A7J6UNG3_PEROL|nr:hypothetical protein FOZ63_013358 [Perkinsus olseni]
MVVPLLLAFLSLTFHPHEVVSSILHRRTVQYEPVLCDKDRGKAGEPPNEELCLVKSPEHDREVGGQTVANECTFLRQILVTSGLAERHISGTVMGLKIDKRGRQGKNSKDFTLVSPNKNFTYRGVEYKGGHSQGDHTEKKVFLSGVRANGHSVTLAPIKPISPTDERILEGRSFTSVDGKVRLTRGLDEDGEFNWRICYEQKGGDYCRPSSVKNNEYIIRSQLDNFKGTFYDLNPGHDDHIIMLADFLDKTVLLVREK